MSLASPWMHTGGPKWEMQSGGALHKQTGGGGERLEGRVSAWDRLAERPFNPRICTMPWQGLLCSHGGLPVFPDRRKACCPEGTVHLVIMCPLGCVSIKGRG